MSRKVITRAKTDNYYRLIKKLNYIGINTNIINYKDNYLYILVSISDYKKLKKYLVTYRFEKVKNVGMYRTADLIKDNIIFYSAIFFGIILFIILKNIYFQINIIHEDKNIRDIIIEELNNYNIKVMHFKKSFNELQRIKNIILDKYPDKIDWLEFAPDGNNLKIFIEKRIITDTKKINKYCNLIATKSGVISDILITNGEASVMINDYVRKNDLLVKGEIRLNDEVKRNTCASGRIYATTWYTVNVHIPFEYSSYEKTGKKMFNIVYEVDGNKKEILRSKFLKKDTAYKPILRIFNFNLYLTKEQELKKITNTYNEFEALEVGINKAVENVKLKLKEFDTIIDKKVLKKSIFNSTMDIEVFVIVKELISTEEYFSIDLEKEKGND